MGRAPLPSPDRQAARELFDQLDPLSGVRAGLKFCAERDSEWAGIPMPIEGKRLVIEPSYPRGQDIAKIGAPPKSEPSEYDDAKIRNTFWSWKKRSTVIVFEHNGKITYGIEKGVNHFEYDLETVSCSVAWSIECESNAIKTLATLVTHHQFKQYMFTGAFVEASKRSGVFYMFRRLRPTVAIGSHRTGGTKILAALCLHPIAYYSGSWAGSMVPTDDVIAHLMLMRGDEHMFWKRSNQHAAYRPEAGL